MRAKDRKQGLVWASFLGDSLSLGAHWIYDPQSIVRKIGRVDHLLPPPPGSFHKGKQAGDFTHYGDQTLVLLQSIVERQGFDLSGFAQDWQRFCAGYTGYFDQATKGTLAGFGKGFGPEKAGSRSNDLAGAARIAPLVFILPDDPEALLQAVQTQTRMTHQDPGVVESAAFFARTVLAVLQGTDPIAAMKQSCEAGYEHLPAGQWVDKGLRAADQESVTALSQFGISCHLPEAFPGTVQLIARYQEDVQKGLIQNVMCGGDSAARGLLLGMVLGACHGFAALPEDWLENLGAGNEIRNLLSRL